MPPEECFGRLNEADKIEQRGLTFQRKVYEGYRTLVREIPRLRSLNVAGESAEAVAAQIWDDCLKHWPWLAQGARWHSVLTSVMLTTAYKREIEGLALHRSQWGKPVLGDDGSGLNAGAF